jgi:hypothetical protein
MAKEYMREARTSDRKDDGLHHLRVHKTTNGHRIEHYHHRDGIEGVNPQEEHTFGPGQGAEVLAHIAKHMDISEQEEEADQSGRMTK